MQRRCDRNRKRSKRRSIHCPIHSCYLDSVSQKHQLFADQADQLRARGMGKKSAMLVMSTRTTVPIQGEWLEAFWCPQCQETRWYHVRKLENNTYTVAIAPSRLWRQATGVENPEGNPTVSEFTRRQARMRGLKGIKNFQSVS